MDKVISRFTQRRLAEQATIPLRTRATCYLLKRAILPVEPLADSPQAGLVLDELAKREISVDERTYRSWWHGSQIPRDGQKLELERVAPGCTRYLELSDLTDPIARNFRVLDTGTIDDAIVKQEALEAIPRLTNEIYLVLDRIWEAFYSPKYRPYGDDLDIEKQAPDVPFLDFYSNNTEQNQNCVSLPISVQQSFDPTNQFGLLKFLTALGIHFVRVKENNALPLLSIDLATLIHCTARTLDVHKITVGNNPEAHPEWNMLLLLMNSFYRSDDSYPFFVKKYCSTETSGQNSFRENLLQVGYKTALSKHARDYYFEQLRSIGITQKYFLDTLGLDQAEVQRTGTHR